MVSEMVGEKFTRLTVIEYAGRYRKYEKLWLCQCDCGNTKVVRDSHLKSGSVKSCGCLQRENGSKSGEAKRGRNVWKIDEENKLAIGTDKSGMTFKVDIEEYERVRTRYWAVDKSRGGYVYSNRHKSECDKTEKRILLHRYIAQAPEGMVVDHINHDPSDNRKSNLRIATRAENGHNKIACGVSFWSKCSKKPWCAAITNNGETRRKWFATAEEAIKQRLSWEEELFGEFAYDPAEDTRGNIKDRFEEIREFSNAAKFC